MIAVVRGPRGKGYRTKRARLRALERQRRHAVGPVRRQDQQP